jgi:hypothetical protein
LELTFVSEIVRNICYDDDKAKEMLGLPVALALKTRLADMRAAEFVSDLIAGSPGEVTLEGSPAYKLNLSTQQQLIFCSCHGNPPVPDGGGIDWHKVSRVKLMKIGPIC